MNNNKWEKDIVICENEKAVLCGQWSPTGLKFAIGTACHHAYVGYYEEKVKWWQTAKIGSFKSSVIAIEWHPSSKVIAIGSCDFSV